MKVENGDKRILFVNHKFSIVIYETIWNSKLLMNKQFVEFSYKLLD